MLVRFDTKWRGITGLIGVLVHSCLGMEAPLNFVENVEIAYGLVRVKSGHLALA
jgi:hypothetical protein